MSRAASTLDITFTGVLLDAKGKHNIVKPYIIEVSPIDFYLVQSTRLISILIRTFEKSSAFIRVTSVAPRHTSTLPIRTFVPSLDLQRRYVPYTTPFSRVKISRSILGRTLDRRPPRNQRRGDRPTQISSGHHIRKLVI
jgi:hypothetical protein